MNHFGGEKKNNTKKSSSSTSSKKASSKKVMKASSTSSKSSKPSKPRSKKGGNFLGYVGELVAPSGWESFATMAGLFAIDRADAALRRGKKTDLKKETTKKIKMNGGNCQEKKPGNISHITIGNSGALFNHYNNNNNRNGYDKLIKEYDHWSNNHGKSNIVIACNKNGKFYLKVNITCYGSPYTYEHLNFYDTFEEAEKAGLDKKNQIALVKLALIDNSKYCKS
jgi:hypothetical protein